MYHVVSSDTQRARGGIVREIFDREYVDRLRNRDPETEAHFTLYFGNLLRIKLRRRLRSVQLIDDLRQETFLRVLTALRQNGIEHPERLGAFVNAVCDNLLYELYRAESRSPKSLPEHLDVPDGHAGLSSTLVDEERKDQVRKVLQGLPPKDRSVLYMIFYEETDREEICRRFGVDREYLRVLVHRAKLRFRKELLNRHGEGFFANA
jgi:RNA polymerase sigma-70 factor (ECF subfamily)